MLYYIMSAMIEAATKRPAIQSVPTSAASTTMLPSYAMPKQTQEQKTAQQIAIEVAEAEYIELLSGMEGEGEGMYKCLLV